MMSVQNGPLELTTDEARIVIAGKVAKWVEFMDLYRLTFASFRIDSLGLHKEETAIDVGLHCEQAEKAGLEVVSHSAVLLRTPAAGDTTVTSILVRREPREN